MSEQAKTTYLKAFDRVAALFADIFIIFPVVLLLTSGIREKLNEYLTLGVNSNLFFGQFLILASGLITLCIYRTALQFFCLRSVGQKLLKVRIISKSQSISRYSFLVKIFLWNFTGLLFPFCVLNISIFYSRSAKSIFDDFFGIGLMSDKGIEKANSNILENTYVQKSVEAFAFLNILLFIGLLLVTGLNFQEKSIDQVLMSSSEVSYPVCSEIDSYHTNWREDGLTSARIETAITLFGIGKISEECLNIEANLALRANSNDELGYLAAYFVTQTASTDSAFLKDLYLKRICLEAPSSPACELSKSLINGSPIKETELLMSKVWGVKRDLVFGRFKSAKRKLYSLPQAFGFDLFITQMNVKLKSLLAGDSYSPVDMSVALSAMDNANQLEFARWICYEDLKGKCGIELTSACTNFIRRAESLPSLDLEDNYLLGKIKICNKDYSSLSKKGVSATVMKYAGNQKTIEEIIFTASVPEFIKLDAIHRLLEVTENKDDVKGLAGEWARQSERDFRWRKLGELLAYKLQFMKEQELATEVLYGLIKEYGRGEFISEPYNLRAPASKVSER